MKMKKYLVKKVTKKQALSLVLCLTLCFSQVPSIKTQAITTKVSDYVYETDELVSGTPEVGESIETNLELYAEKDEFWMEQWFENRGVDETGGFGKWLYTPKGATTESVLSDGAFDEYGYSQLTLKDEWAGGTLRVRYVFDDGTTLYSKPVTVIGGESTDPVTPDPDKPVTPDPDDPVTPDPDKPVTPDPDKPVTPEKPVVTDTAIEADSSKSNEIQFGKTYKGESTAWYYGNPGQYSYYHFTSSNLPKDSVIRVEIESSDVVKYRYWESDNTYYDANPGDVSWGKSQGVFNIYIHAKSDWKIKFSREDFDYGSVKVTWNQKDLVGGKVLNDTEIHFSLDYTPGSNFGVVNTGYHILDDEAVKTGWVLRNSESGNHYEYTYRASKIGQDMLTIHYGDKNTKTEMNIPINVCPEKPKTPIKISGSPTSVTLNHISNTTSWKAEIYKGGKWVNAGNATQKAIKIKGLKAKTAYKFRIFDVKPAAAGVPELCSPASSVFTVKTAPTAKPVIKSVKISNVKKNYHKSQYNPGQWVGNVYNRPTKTQPYWTTSFKVTITMKNTIPGSSSRCVKMKMKKGRVITKVLKGNKKKYTFVVSLMGKYKASQLKGKATTISASTDSEGLVVGPASKAVKSK